MSGDAPGVPVAGDLEEADQQMSLSQIADALDRNGCGRCAPHVEYLADQVRRNWANAAVVQEVFSTLLRGMARRASELRREAREEYIGRQIAEQNLRYAPLSGIHAYRRAMSAAFFANEPMPPIPEVITAVLGGSADASTLAEPTTWSQTQSRTKAEDGAPVSPREDETPEPAADPQPVNTDLLERLRQGVTSREAPHLVDAAAPAMRKLLARVQDGMWTAEDARDVLLDWPNRVVSTTPDPAAREIAAAEAVVVRAALHWATGPHPHWDSDNALLGAVAAYRAALAGTAATPEPDLGAALDAIQPRPHISVSFDDGPGVACGCCEIDWQLCRGLYDKGMARCCSDCTHNLAGVPSALLGTWADPEFRAHQEHKHPVAGCGYCPEEEATT